MDLKQLENMIAIDDERNIAKAAKKMFMTQSALNQQLLKLEKELGTNLFERHYHELIPTLAGRLYISSAKQILNIKEDTYKIIRDVASEKVGEISIAYTPERGSVLFSEIYPIFHKEYPDFRFKTFEARGPQSVEKLLKREVTFGMITYSKQHPLNPAFDRFITGRESMILVLPASHPLAALAGDESWKTFPELDLNLLKNDEFILCSHETSMRKMIDYIFKANDFTPKILLESANSMTILRMVSQQMGPAFLPESYATPGLPVVFFHVKPVQYWNHCIAYLKGTYITKPERRFFELLKEHSKAKGRED